MRTCGACGADSRWLREDGEDLVCMDCGTVHIGRGNPEIAALRELRASAAVPDPEECEQARADARAAFAA